MERSLDPTRQLVERHAAYLRRLARALVHDEAAAQDVAQETWRVALEQRTHDVEQPRAWLAGIARRIAWRRLRDDERRAGRERDVARPEGSADVDALDVGDTLQAAMRRLDEPFREAVVQRYLNDLPPREIARRTGVPLGTVKSRLKRGLAALREDLDRQHGGDRRTWAIGLLAGLDLPAPTSLVPHGRTEGPASTHPTHLPPSTAAHGTLWTATFGMNIKLIAASALVVSASLWALNREGSVAPGSMTLTTAVEDAASGLADLELGATPGTNRRGEAPAPTSAAPTVAETVMHPFAMEFLVRDGFGDPIVDVDVQIAPEDHSFVSVGRTNADGRLRVDWQARTVSMTVDVALVDRDDDLVGVQRMEVETGRTRSLETRTPREQGSQFELRGAARQRPVEGAEPRGIDGDTSPKAAPEHRLRPRRGASNHDRERRVLFALDGDVTGLPFLGSVPLLSSLFTVEGSARPAAATDSDSPPDPNAPMASIEGVVSDEHGRVATGYPVRFIEPGSGDRVSHVMTDREGRFRLESRAGDLRCFVGDGETRVALERTVAPGEVVQWSPSVERHNDLILGLRNTEGRPTEGVLVQVRVDDGARLWVGRGKANDQGRAVVLGCPTTTVDVDLIAPEKIAAVSALHVPDVPTGSLWSYEIDESTISALPIHLAPVDTGRAEQSATELLIFDQGRTWGQRVRIPGETGSQCSAVLPVGIWWLEVATHRTGRTEIGPVHVVGEQPIDLGRVTLEPLGQLELPPLVEQGESLEVHHLRDDVDSRVARRGDRADDDSPGEEARSNVLELRPGRYRVTRAGRAGRNGAIEVVTVDVRADERSVVEF